jgi:prepilin-type N-terminal cleavage/methylation domain-containing protein
MARAFTLIELILVMALLTIAVSMTAPLLSRFFRGRALDLEARRLLALTRQAQSRAVSEGLPMDLWFNPEEGCYGLNAEPAYEKADPKEVKLSVEEGLHLDVDVRHVTVATNTVARDGVVSRASVPRVNLVHPALPTIRFLPDGSLGPNSPEAVSIVGRDGETLWVRLARNRLNYEIGNSSSPNTDK